MTKPISECSYMAETAAATALAAANIPTDIQELLLRGNPMLGVAPGALRAALCAAVTTTAAFEGGSYLVEAAGGGVHITMKTFGMSEGDPLRPMRPVRVPILAFTPDRARLFAERVLQAADAADK